MKKNNILFILLHISCASLFSCEEALESSLTDKKVILIAPGDSVTTDSPVNFYWEPVDAATSYRLQLVTPSFDDIELLITDTTLPGTLLTLQLEAGEYAWRVKALNSSSSSGEGNPRVLIIK